MRVLIVTPGPPVPPYDGLRLPLASIASRLTVDHDVRVLAGAGTGPPAQAPSWLRTAPVPTTTGRGAVVARWGRYLAGRPLGVDHAASALAPAVREQVAEFQPDVVHVFSGRLAAVRFPPHVPSVLTALDAWHHNVDAQRQLARGVRRLGLTAQHAAVRRFIAREYPRYDVVVAVTSDDAAALVEVAPSLRTRVIGNGVELTPAGACTTTGPRPSRLLFHGVLSYPPNVDAARWAGRDILPRVREHVPGAELALVGRAPDPAVEALGDLPGVRVIGEVDELAPWFAWSDVYLCPMRLGTGIKNKLLEAMAAGCACVATPLALQGISAVPGRHLVVGEDAGDLAVETVRLLGDRARAAELGHAAQELVRAEHTWDAVARAYADLYAELGSAQP